MQFLLSGSRHAASVWIQCSLLFYYTVPAVQVKRGICDAALQFYGNYQAF